MTLKLEATDVAIGPCRLPSGESGPSVIASAGVVHDLGNLIQIATSAVNIVTRSQDMAPSESGAILLRAKNSLEQAGALVRQTIGLIRGRPVPACDARVDACLGDVAALIEALHHTGLVLEIDIEPELPGARCDPLALRNAVLNLVFNARDAMAGDGVVAIAGRSIRSGQSICQVEIAVTDQGIGMSAATIERAFDPFFTTKSDGLGGVGLPMVERFVREAGGEIFIRSELGAGTTVTLRLPAAIQDSPQKEAVR
jgi:signal transduction histidine kinase